MCTARVQSRICQPAGDTWRCLHRAVAVGASVTAQPQDRLQGCTGAHVRAVVRASCLETLGLDMEGNMNKLGYTGQNSHAWDAIAVLWVPGQRAKRTRVAISYSQLIAPPSVEEASSPERNRKLWNVLICPKSQNSNQKFYLNFWPSFFTFLLPFAGSPDPTQILPCLLCPNSTKHTVTTEDQAHTACSFPTLHKHSPTMKPAGFFPITVTDGISQVLGRQSQHGIATPCLEDINPQQAPGSEFTTVSP